MKNIAILTRPEYRSPRILAETLKSQIEKTGNRAELIFEIALLAKVGPFWNSHGNFFFLLKQYFQCVLDFNLLLKKLRCFDAIVICECTPNAFWRKFYKVEYLRSKLGVPIFLYEVYYLGNAPTQISKLIEAGDALFDRFDFHLSVSDITEIRVKHKTKWACIGLDLSATSLKPLPRDEFVVLMDFPQLGYENYRDIQIRVLNDLGIKIMFLDGEYSTEHIRELYQMASIFMMQSFEAFGVSIAECLSCGTQIFTPESSWPMSWRLDNNPSVHGNGLLPDCFTVYHGEIELRRLLLHYKDITDLKTKPFKVFENFITVYPHYYYGDHSVMKRIFNDL